MTILQNKSRRRLRVVNKARLTIFVALTLLIISPAILFAMDRPIPAMPDELFIRVHVEEGDTLWRIAQDYLPANTDIRSFINKIKVTNKLDSALIKEGDLLLIPDRS